MQRILGLALAAALWAGASQAAAQSVTFDFETGDDQGWGNKFSDGSAVFPIDNVGGSQRMRVLRNGDFQEAERNAGNDGSAFYNSMAAAAAAPGNYLIKYDYYIDTAGWGVDAGTFLQVGTYVNSGSGYYKQHENEVQLDGDQLASGQLFQGTISQTFTAKTFEIPPADTFFRLGFIINGNGAAQTVHFDNVSVTPVPEPAAMALVAAAIPALRMARRRRG